MAFPAHVKLTSIFASALILGQPVFATDNDVSSNAPSTETPIIAELIVAPDPSARLRDTPVCQTFNAGSQSMICACPPGFDTGLVWGSGPYSGDSHICTAATHAGLISGPDYLIEIVSRGANDRYPGTTNNGVTTRDWGSYGESYDIIFVPVAPDEGSQDADVAVALEASEEDETRPAASPVARPEPVEIIETPDDAVASILPQCAVLPHGLETYACSCRGGQVSGSVWGAGPYTADSNICTAAIHAGLIGADGGDVTLIRIPGLENYAASTVNHVQTQAWKSFTSSFTFNWN